MSALPIPPQIQTAAVRQVTRAVVVAASAAAAKTGIDIIKKTNDTTKENVNTYASERTEENIENYISDREEEVAGDYSCESVELPTQKTHTVPLFSQNIPNVDIPGINIAADEFIAPRKTRASDRPQARYTGNGGINISVPLPLMPVALIGYALGSWLFSSGESESSRTVRTNGPAPRDLVKDPSCDNPIIPPYPYEPLAKGSPAAKKFSKSNSGGCEDGSKPSKVSKASGLSSRDPGGPEDSGGNIVGSSALGGKIIHITKNDMKDLLNSSGKSIHKK